LRDLRRERLAGDLTAALQHDPDPAIFPCETREMTRSVMLDLAPKDTKPKGFTF
jgi:hypothetical protein